MAGEESKHGPCSTKRKAEVACCSEEEKAADLELGRSDEEEEEMIVMSDEKVDCILSWDYAGRLPYERFDGEDGFTPEATADWNDACDFFEKAEKELIEFQEEVRREKETQGYVRVSADYEKKVEEGRAAFNRAFPYFGFHDEPLAVAGEELKEEEPTKCDEACVDAKEPEEEEDAKRCH